MLIYSRKGISKEEEEDYVIGNHELMQAVKEDNSRLVMEKIFLQT